MSNDKEIARKIEDTAAPKDGHVNTHVMDEVIKSSGVLNDKLLSTAVQNRLQEAGILPQLALDTFSDPKVLEQFQGKDGRLSQQKLEQAAETGKVDGQDVSPTSRFMADALLKRWDTIDTDGRPGVSMQELKDWASKPESQNQRDFQDFMKGLPPELRNITDWQKIHDHLHAGDGGKTGGDGRTQPHGEGPPKEQSFDDFMKNIGSNLKNITDWHKLYQMINGEGNSGGEGAGAHENPGHPRTRGFAPHRGTETEHSGEPTGRAGGAGGEQVRAGEQGGERTGAPAEKFVQPSPEDVRTMPVKLDDGKEVSVNIPTREGIEHMPVEQLRRMQEENQRALEKIIGANMDKLPDLGFHGSPMDGWKDMMRKGGEFGVWTAEKIPGDPHGTLGNLEKAVEKARQWCRRDTFDPTAEAGPILVAPIDQSTIDRQHCGSSNSPPESTFPFKPELVAGMIDPETHRVFDPSKDESGRIDYQRQQVAEQLRTQALIMQALRVAHVIPEEGGDPVHRIDKGEIAQPQFDPSKQFDPSRQGPDYETAYNRAMHQIHDKPDWLSDPFYETMKLVDKIGDFFSGKRFQGPEEWQRLDVLQQKDLAQRMNEEAKRSGGRLPPYMRDYVESEG